MKKIEVVCGIIKKRDKIFIAKKRKDKSLAGYWEFPGGKIEHSENAEDALKRELYEELGMKVKVLNRITSNTHNYDEIQVFLIAYLCEFKEASYEMTDHDQYAWISKNEFNNYKMAPADLPIIEYI
ncbi:(deoxy)nucleoside triphosphate pyrophosphohydrolase [Psychroserpens sp.]|uniref:(deoxy)nucleoside triphosphate pyrophosphohydrolase n=1 Tax=Psychroserpens sp. TaxID=2020870 RepID=UPI001B195E48|nr:(deoxy)nucleoside triphosphate pyrophosphohydrolase [Psychroserpens sp.]MBO6607405.1 (deoxy)nucleoside triphosphate pyrophosphohydrolase [Psychroserpens sp.]MBO6632463.1 (deoxy)nucleoside triphosphate pyrophosphohydrolase [Psychroserpens sp.]MBO6654517.1 (deoxy)nucleoside triphosphate pyrophosphohydrolase [Psychroserpens sp.]MBO6681134.1 (deoxy)nucleoside triphosphate pyrophosphohydrolase [Psychroserpens sp.]MBO6749909.1 (deoxy)nucleoside triphosphate pyrophosphohydrolase [Psychroserpens sp